MNTSTTTTHTRSRRVRRVVRIMGRAVVNCAFVVFAVFGAMVGYAAGRVLGLHPALCLVLAGPSAVFVAVGGEDITFRALAAMRRGRRVAPVVESVVRPPVDRAEAVDRMTRVAEVDARTRAEQNAAHHAYMRLDADQLWLADERLWQAHREGGASLHLAPGVRLIWHGGPRREFSIVSGESAIHTPVTTAAQLRAHLAGTAPTPAEPEPGGRWEQLV